MSKAILVIFALQFLLSRHRVSTTPVRTASFVSDDDSDDSDDDQTSSDENSDSDDEDATESEGENDEDTSEPSHFNCVLLGDEGCKATCSSIASLYGTESEGTCDSSHICQCTLQSKTLTELWFGKFRKDEASKSLLEKINDDAKLRKQVHQILREFPRTPADTIQQLKEKYPETKKYNKLKPNEKLKMPVSKYIDKRGQLNKDKLRKNLSAQVQKSLKKGNFSIDKVDYKSNVDSFLKEDEPVLPTVVNDESFAKFVSKFFPKDTIEETTEPESPVFEQVPDLVESTVIEQFVKHLEDKKKTDKEKKKSQKKDEKKTNDKKPRQKTKQKS